MNDTENLKEIKVKNENAPIKLEDVLDGVAARPPKKKEKAISSGGNISYAQELKRKSIHLLSLSIPVAYVFLDRSFALSILAPLALLAIAVDLASKKVPAIHDLFFKVFGPMMRKHEKKKNRLLLNGASWVLISACLMVIFFPKTYVVVGFTILIFADIAAALIGRRYGKTPLFNKSWEGTSAFIITALIVVAIYGQLFSAPFEYFVIASIAAIAAGFAEAAAKKIKMDDNLSIPLAFCLVMTFGEMIISAFGLSISRLIQ
ncbi:MAG: diacylglycerol/polyprenol kinase family protein [Chloroflexota bacterium]